MQKDLVSVIIPVYNAEKYIEEAVVSICNQTYAHIEILIINDGSTDGSKNILERLAGKDNRITFVSRENRGLQATLNELIDMADGEYIARMDADDISEPDRIAMQKQYMDLHQDVDVLGTSMRVFGGDNRTYIARRYISREQRQIRMLFSNAGLVHPTAFFRSATLDKMKLRYNTENHGAEDYEMWCNILENGGRLEELKDVLFSYRVHSSQVTTSKSDVVSDSRDFVRKREISKFGINEEEIYDIMIEWFMEYDSDKADCYYDALCVLIGANKKTRRFNKRLFISEIMYQWVVRAIDNAKHGKWKMCSLKYMKNLLNPLISFYVIREILEDQKVIKASRI